MVDVNSIGKKLKELRKEHRLTLEEVAKRLNTTKQTINKYEMGIIANIPPEKIEALANVYNTTPAEIMGWNDGDKYYLNDETAQIAQEIYKNKSLRMLFDASRKASKEDLLLATQILNKFND